MATRRQFLIRAAAAGALSWHLSRPAVASRAFQITLSDAEWRQRLTPAQYAVLREHATERPYSSPLNDEHRGGVFACAGCRQPLFSSRTKFDSRTGWPSFWQALPDAVEVMADTAFGMMRTEVHCERCGGHLGHVFQDGPPPTGLRYCINGDAITFAPGPA